MTRAFLLWIASLVLVSVATLAFAQVRFPTPEIASGADIGFRIDGTDASGRPFGVLVVRRNGEWREVGSTATIQPAKTIRPAR
jgi:hypothetical protein